MKAFALTLFALLALWPAGPTRAQTVTLQAAPPAEAAPQDPGPGSAVVEELEVVARLPGPALWRVTRGGSEVVILGAVSPIAHQQAWDRGRVERLMEGSRLVLTPPQISLGLLGLPQMALGGLAKVRGPAAEGVEQTLDPARLARFQTQRALAGKPAGRYARWRPAVAGFMLLSDVNEASGLSLAKPGSSLAGMAKTRRIRVRPLASLNAARVVKAVGALTPAQHLNCLDMALEQAEAEPGRARTIGDAWAGARLGELRGLYGVSILERCMAQAPGFQGLHQEAMSQSLSAVNAALATPGRTIVVVDMTMLLRRDGLLDRLKASGAEISVPLD